MKSGPHTHDFVNQYEGLVGFGLDRETDEKSLMVYLQKFSDDSHLASLIPRLSDQEIQEIFDLVSRIIRTHLKEEEYHRLFLKEVETKQAVSDTTVKDVQVQQEQRLESGEEQLRWLCSKRGLEWDHLSEEEREAFIEDLTRA